MRRYEETQGIQASNSEWGDCHWRPPRVTHSLLIERKEREKKSFPPLIKYPTTFSRFQDRRLRMLELLGGSIHSRVGAFPPFFPLTGREGKKEGTSEFDCVLRGRNPAGRKNITFPSKYLDHVNLERGRKYPTEKEKKERREKRQPFSAPRGENLPLPRFRLD